MRKIPNELKNFTETNILQISGEPTELLKLFSIVSEGEENRTKSVGRIKLFFVLALFSFPFGNSIIGIVMKLVGSHDLYLRYDFIPFTINLAILFSVLGFFQVYKYYKARSNKLHPDFRTKVIPFLTKLTSNFEVKEFKNIKIDLRSFEEKQIGKETTIKEECYPDLRNWEYQDNWFSGTLVLESDEEMEWKVEINLHKTDTFFNNSEGNKAKIESVIKYSVTIQNKTTQKIVKDTVMEYDYKRLFDAELMLDLLKCRT